MSTIKPIFGLRWTASCAQVLAKINTEGCTLDRRKRSSEVGVGSQGTKGTEMGTCGRSLGTRWFCESLCCLLIRGMKEETNPRSPHITSRRREPTRAQACASPVLLRRAAEKCNFTLYYSKWGCWNLGVTIQRLETDCNSSKYHAKRGTKEPCLTW